jgi:flagellar M-ring protein FliF
MNLVNQLSQVGKNLSELGQGRLMALVGVGLLAVGLIITAGIFLNKPASEVLYIGLSSDDVNQIGTSLSEARIDFSVGADGTSVLVAAGTALHARAILAERGLPNSSTAGYELFDDVGSLGLTSFMQEVTRVRALEGEIARTIQKINGINAARVHIVMADTGNFRSGEQKPSASVMVKTSNAVAHRSADSIRHLVASSVPGLSVDEVTVLDSTGKLLASGDDFSNSTLNRSMSVIQIIQNEIENNIDKALSPFLGIDNFRSSVMARVNTDTQQIQETVFDPESRVGRSTRVTRENQTSNSSNADAPATVEQNIPDQAQAGGGTPQSSELAERKEEQTNYEINSKVTQTVRNSYEIEKLSIAVVVNDARVIAMLGAEATEEQIETYLQELEQVITTAAGLDNERGDVVKLTRMAFLATEMLSDTAATNGFMEMLIAQLGTIINAVAFIIVAFLVVWFGFRPILNVNGGRTAVAAQGGEALESLDDVDGLELPDFSPGGMDPMAGGMPGGGAMDGFGADFGFDAESEFGTGDDSAVIEEGMSFTGRVKGGPEKRLSSMVEISEERAAKVLRKWAIGDAA